MRTHLSTLIWYRFNRRMIAEHMIIGWSLNLHRFIDCSLRSQPKPWEKAGRRTDFPRYARNSRELDQVAEIKINSAWTIQDMQISARYSKQIRYLRSSLDKPRYFIVYKTEWVLLSPSYADFSSPHFVSSPSMVAIDRLLAPAASRLEERPCLSPGFVKNDDFFRKLGKILT